MLKLVQNQLVPNPAIPGVAGVKVVSSILWLRGEKIVNLEADWF